MDYLKGIFLGEAPQTLPPPQQEGVRHPLRQSLCGLRRRPRKMPSIFLGHSIWIILYQSLYKGNEHLISMA